MKKGLILFTALFLLSTFTAFAAVTAVKEGDVVKVTWTYENADAASVGLVGDFQGWNLAGALPMTKDASGKWTITLDGKADSEYKYKFNVDGEWTEDPAAPAGVDDGFGGTNGYAVVADLLAASGASGAGAVAAAPKGLIVGNYEAVWAGTHFVTENPNDKSKKGLSLDNVYLSHKDYFKFDGYMFKDLLKTTGEIQLFDGQVDIYKKMAAIDPVTGNYVSKETVSLSQGGANLATIPFTMFNSFGAAWPALKGKFRANLELHNLNLNIAHSVGWSKGAQLGLGKILTTIWSNPDSNSGVTELYSSKPFDLGDKNNFAYYINLDKHNTNFQTNVILWPTFAGIEFELANSADLGISDFNNPIKNVAMHTLFGAKASFGTLDVKAQGQLRTTTDSTVTWENPFGIGLSANYKMDAITLYTELFYTGKDAATGYNASGDFKLPGDGTQYAHIDGDINNLISVTYNAGTIVATLGNEFWTPTKAPTTDVVGDMGDQVTLTATYDSGIKIVPTVKMSLPLDGSKFTVDSVRVDVGQGALNGSLYFIPNADFTANDARVKVTYDLDASSGVLLGLGTQFGSAVASTANPFGLTLGYNLKTPFDGIKNPYFMVTADYNLNPMDGNDNYKTKGIDDGAWKVGTGADIRVGLQWNF